MIRQRITESTFRENDKAVQAAKEFFGSQYGQMFVAALEHGSVVSVLTSRHNQNEEHARDLAIAESAGPGTADNLLGKTQGYELCLKMMDRLTEKLERAPEHKAKSKSFAVTKKLSQTSNEQ